LEWVTGEVNEADACGDEEEETDEEIVGQAINNKDRYHEHALN
jgi:hypothetical protein